MGAQSGELDADVEPCGADDVRDRAVAQGSPGLVGDERVVALGAVELAGELLGVHEAVGAVFDVQATTGGQDDGSSGVGDRLEEDVVEVGDVQAGSDEGACGSPVGAGVATETRPHRWCAGGAAWTDSCRAEELVAVDLEEPTEGERGDLVGPQRGEEVRDGGGVLPHLVQAGGHVALVDEGDAGQDLRRTRRVLWSLS